MVARVHPSFYETPGPLEQQGVKLIGKKADEFEKLTRIATVTVNGVLVGYRKGKKTKLQDGDVVSFVKATAGG